MLGMHSPTELHLQSQRIFLGCRSIDRCTGIASQYWAYKAGESGKPQQTKDTGWAVPQGGEVAYSYTNSHKVLPLLDTTILELPRNFPKLPHQSSL
jgi:hypothetical protein